MTHPLSSLSAAQSSVLSSVSRYRQVTSSQLRRLHYEGTPDGTRVRSRRHLARLTRLGLVARLWGIYDGAAEFVYQPTSSKARTTDMHTLDITELYVKLMETTSPSMSLLAYDPEPWSYVTVGHMELKPDAYTRIKTGSGVYQYFIEVDRGTEFKSQLSQKMRRYVRAFERWEEPTFPQVVWVCHDADRQRFIHSVVKRQEVPGLFVVHQFSEVVDKLVS